MEKTIHINAAAIIERTMNRMDPRLMNHGKRVGYLLYRVLRLQGWEEARLRDIALLGLLHDIGAYKTEEIDRMVHFETREVWAHSVYGYLFMKHFSPMQALAPVLLYHHATAAQLAALDDETALLAGLVHLCDRVDILYLSQHSQEEVGQFLNTTRGRLFSHEAVDLFFAAGITPEIWGCSDTDPGFVWLLYEMPMPREDAVRFMEMVVYSIDFRSPQTMLHTFALRLAARTLAERCGLGTEEAGRIEVGALLHDIGKMGTPLHILESTEKLSPEDFAVMKNHVVVSEEILAGNVDGDIAAMAVNHHEKADGSGYPKGLRGDTLPVADRIIAVADVLSALWGSRSYKAAMPKSRILEIMGNMRGPHLDPALVDLATAHYDDIADAMVRHATPVEALYKTIAREQRDIHDALNEGLFKNLLTVGRVHT